MKTDYYKAVVAGAITVCLFVETTSIPDDNRKTIKLSLLSSTSKDAILYAGAFFVALDYVNQNRTFLEGYKLDYIFNNTNMNSLKAINAMTEHHGMGTVGFIGPDASCLCESTIAAAWNLPMLVYKCHDSKISKMELENVNRRTFARTQPSTSKVSKSIISILQYYNWQRITLVVGGLSIWNETAESLMDLSKKNNIYVSKVVYFREPYSFSDEMYSIVAKTYEQTRIYVFLGDHHALVDFNRLLKEVLGDTISDYVIIAYDERFYTEDAHQYLIKTPFEEKNDLNSMRIKSFETVLLLVPRPPSNTLIEDFYHKVRIRNTLEPVSSLLQPVYDGKPIKVPVYAAYLYDAVYTYAFALGQVIRQGGSPSNGTAIIDLIRNRTYTSILGYDVYVDIQGDAEGNYTLLTFDVHRDDGGVGLVPAANFSMTQNGIGIPALNMFRPIKWRNKHPPLDEPICGFDGKKCEKEFEWRILAVCIVIAVVCLIAGGFALRHYLYEQKLARLLWKIDYKDIAFVDSVDDINLPTRKKRKRSRNQPFKFIYSYDNESERANLLGEIKREHSTSSDNKRILIGSYKGTIVSVKHIVRKSVEIDRDLKKQLQLRKELNHDNITRFIGACVETPHVYILTQYCQRGSLYDILQNEDFSLDDMFISSLVSDLLKAMMFIHDSEFGSHGNLKSSNCVIDARWVLMVTDFGLDKLDSSERSDSFSDPEKYYQKLLWKAPELLRNNAREAHGTQKGDVYAFALILYEMIGRKGPWGDMPYSSRDIIDRIKQGNSELRPDLSILRCESFVKECIAACWSEEPEQRPDVKCIRFRLKAMLQGIKSNIFDNMLEMMEKYANNLENLVQERTEQLSEEKKMTENLLLRMLPRFVADRLKRGEPVVPELYECVSIYFSDIVGFTALSAESTPMEVVCMLNDLYTCFDAILENYDVYKIETIGDAYFVVSGLPLRNEDLHAGEIASMALHMLREIKNFKIRHRPKDTLMLRIGIHSGPCVAGVVGLKMPRYTLFGDTVNTASRMESTGVPLKIHCSSDITSLLRKLGGYELVERGYITAKGKGEMLTYFLESENVSHRQRRISNTKFSRQNSPQTYECDIFGASTLHPKYWSNGSIPSPSAELDTPFFLRDTEHEISSRSGTGNAVRNKNNVCHIDTERVNEGVQSGNFVSLHSNTCGSVKNGPPSVSIDQTHFQGNKNPFRCIDGSRSPNDRRPSDNSCLVENGNGAVQDKDFVMTKLNLTRNNSLPPYMFEEDVV